MAWQINNFEKPWIKIEKNLEVVLSMILKYNIFIISILTKPINQIKNAMRYIF